MPTLSATKLLLKWSTCIKKKEKKKKKKEKKKLNAFIYVLITLYIYNKRSHILHQSLHKPLWHNKIE